jgi:hypothetical protein
VGFIHGAGLHQPFNPTAHWSLSLHVISPHDGRPRPDEAPLPPALAAALDSGPDAGPDAEENARKDLKTDAALATLELARMSQQWLRELARIAAASAAPRAPAVLEACAALGTTRTRRHVRQLRREPEPGHADHRRGAPYRLQRSPAVAALHADCIEGRARLCIDTPRGAVAQLAASALALPALRFAARQAHFDVAALPGDLDRDERLALAEALEDSGLFKRVEA